MGGVVNSVFGSLNRSSQSQTENVSLAAPTQFEGEAFTTVVDEFRTLQDILRGNTVAQPYFNQFTAAGEQYANQLGGYQDALGGYAGQFNQNANSLYSAFAGLAGQDYTMNQNDINDANSYAANLYAPQRAGLEQAFRNQTMDSNRLASSLGRSINDPILQSKLRTGFMDQTAALNAQQTASAQQIAFQLPGQRLASSQAQGGFYGNQYDVSAGNYQNQFNALQGMSGFGGQRVGALGDVYGAQQAAKDQATQNRLSLLGLGQQLQQQGQNFRLASAGRTTTGSNQGSALSTLGGIAGIAGAGFGLAGMMGGGK